MTTPPGTLVPVTPTNPLITAEEILAVILGDLEAFFTGGAVAFPAKRVGSLEVTVSMRRVIAAEGSIITVFGGVLGAIESVLVGSVGTAASVPPFTVQMGRTFVEFATLLTKVA